MLTALLNPRVILAVAVLCVFGVLLLKVSAQKTQIATLKGDVAIKQETIQDLTAQITNLGSMVDILKKNLAAAKQSIREMQAVKEEANALRRRIIELQNEPTACEALKVEYEKVASDITVMFNDRVRRKLNRNSDGNRTAGEVLPGPIEADADRPKVNAGAAR